MGFVPEFFILLGIVVFVATSLVSALIDEDLPSFLQYLCQGLAALGLGLLLMGPATLSGQGIWISIVYVAVAASNLVAMNVYLAVVKRKDALSSILTGVVTVPTFAVSAVLIASYLETAGELVLTPAVVAILSVAAVAICISLSGFIPESYLRIFGLSRGSQPVSNLPTLMEETGELSLVPQMDEGAIGREKSPAESGGQ